MGRVAVRVEDGGDIVGDVGGQRKGIDRRDAQVLGEAARAVDADPDRVAAQVTPPGAALKAAGFENLVAVDYSAGMLEIAARKGIYRETMQADLSQRTAFPDDAFDAVVTVGTTSQMPCESLRELVRLVRPGGRIVFTVYPEAYVNRGYAAIQQEFEAEGRLSVIYRGEAFQALPTPEPEIWYEIWVFEILT